MIVDGWWYVCMCVCIIILLLLLLLPLLFDTPRPIPSHPSLCYLNGSITITITIITHYSFLRTAIDQYFVNKQLRCLWNIKWCKANTELRPNKEKCWHKRKSTHTQTHTYAQKRKEKLRTWCQNFLVCCRSVRRGGCNRMSKELSHSFHLYYCDESANFISMRARPNAIENERMRDRDRNTHSHAHAHRAKERRKEK